MSKSKNKNIVELIIIFIITLIINLLFQQLTTDEIWNYGFSYNIASGLIPYKDFNLVIFPLYPILNALIMLIFGKSFLVFHIFNAILCTFIFKIIKALSPHACYIIYSLLPLFSSPNYNLLCLLLLLIIIYIENQDSPNNYLIGLLIGLIIITKQNVGLLLLVPCLAIKLKSPKELLKRVIGATIPILLMLLYLIITKSLTDWFNYTILGLQEFSADNKFFDPQGYIIFPIIILLLYQLIIKKDQSKSIIYSLFFIAITYPFCDAYHIIIAIIPSLIYLLEKLLNKLKFSIKLEQISFLIVITFFIIYGVIPIFSNKKTYPNQTTVYKYRLISKNQEQVINTVATYLKKVDQDVSLYVLEPNAYLYKLEAGLPINKYDLINDGNMGKDGAQVYNKEINQNCSQNKCIFLINEYDIINATNRNQTNKDILNNIIKNYQFKEPVSYLSVYENKK